VSHRSKLEQAVAHSRFKIEWAIKHINNLEKLIEFLTSENRQVVKSQRDPQTGRYNLYIGPEGGIPATLPLLMGDAIHNLNSVIDFLKAPISASERVCIRLQCWL